jgi:hypothetical protein
LLPPLPLPLPQAKPTLGKLRKLPQRRPLFNSSNNRTNSNSSNVKVELTLRHGIFKNFLRFVTQNSSSLHHAKVG